MGQQRDPGAPAVVEVCEIGHLGVRSGGRWHPVRGERTRAALATLSLHLDEGVRTESLLEAVWPSPDRPPTARQSLANLVARLRSAHGDRFVESTGDGYRLGAHVESDRARLLADVSGASDQLPRAPDEALRTIDRTLDRVRGRPWHDVEFPVEVEADRARLEVQIARAHRLRASALVAVDCAGEAIPLLERSIGDDPTDESCWLELAGAQAALGRRVDALRTLRRARRQLAEHGLTVGESTAELERRLLRGSPEVARVGAEFPPVATALLGRERLLAEVGTLLRSERVVTLCGPAGVGKTRLAVEIGRCSRRDEQRFVDLSPIHDDDLVPSAVAAALGVVVPPGLAPTEAVVDEIGDGAVLLVLDNCEQVVRGVGELVASLVAECPSCQVVATSREHLAIPAERILRVEPLPTGPDDAGVELFFDRARRLGADLPADPWREPVADLCRSLDGLPLAIELAAGRTAVLTPTEIIAALEERFALLRGAGGASLEDAIAWSWDLLDATEQRALHRLSVFHSGATLDAASSVLDLDRWSTIDLAERLARKSLLTIRQTPNRPTRLELLDSIRHFVLADAERAGTIAACRDAHLDWIDEFTRNVFEECGGVDPLTQIDAERHELRAALDHAQSGGTPAIGVRVIARCFHWWRGRSTAAEGTRRLQALLPIADLEIADRASASTVLASLARISALPDAEVDVLIADAHRHLEEMPPSLDRDRIELRLAEAEFDDRDPDLGPRLRRLADVGASSNDTAALHLLTAWTITNAPDDAPAVAAELAEEFRDRGFACTAHAAEMQGLAAIATGRLQRASAHLVDAFDHHRASGQNFCAVHCCESVAWLAVETGDVETARSLLAATQGVRRRHGRSRAGFEEQAITGALRTLGELPAPDHHAEIDDTIDAARQTAARLAG